MKFIILKVILSSHVFILKQKVEDKLEMLNRIHSFFF